jgi:hypothetical protein
MDHRAMVQSIRVQKEKSARGEQAAAANAAASSAAAALAAVAAAAAPPKLKKLSEKGKTKLATHRARERMEADLAAAEQAYAEAHPELIDEHGEMEMPLADALFADGMDEVERLARYVGEERKQIENEEMVRKLSKLQKKHNAMQNAMLKGNKIGQGYDRDTVDLKVVQKQLKRARKDEEEKIIVLDEALPLYRDMCDASAKGQKALFAYLEQEHVLRELSQADLRYLRASVDATLERRKSPLNFRVEVVWRVACTIQEWKRGEREQNLRLALHSYTALLERCDPDAHPFQYAGLQNTRELCELELERVTGYKILQRANHDFEYVSKEDPTAMYKFERKKQ